MFTWRCSHHQNPDVAGAVAHYVCALGSTFVAPKPTRLGSDRIWPFFFGVVECSLWGAVGVLLVGLVGGSGGGRA